MKKLIFVLIIICAIIVYYFMKSERLESMYDEGEVQLAGQTIQVDVSRTQEEKSLGLSGRDGLAENQGMWFIYEQPRTLSFWMKDMNFPIDIIWIRDGEVIDITLNAQPEPGVAETDLSRYWPRTSADTVLEVRSGWTRDHGVKIGDTVDFRENF